MNINKPYTSLKTAFFAALLAAGVFVFLFFYIGINQRKFSYEDSKLLAREISRKAASETEIYFASAVQAARSMEQKAVIYKSLKADRKNINNLLLTNLNLNPNFLAIWTMWEHNAYDGRDTYFRKEEIYDTLGNLSVTYFRYKDSVFLEHTQPEDYYEDYYTIPKSTRSELIIEPYFYQYTGFPYVFHETSVVVPIFIDSMFVGVFGIDINLDSLQQKLNHTKLYKSGYLSLISHNGIIVSHKDTNWINTSFYKLLSPDDSIVYQSIISGKEYSHETISEFTGKEVFRFFYPIKIGKGLKPWSMMVEIPIEDASNRAKQMLMVAFGILLLGLILILFLIFNLFDRRRDYESIHRAFRKVEESEEKYRTLLESMNEMVIMADNNHVVQYVNKKFTEILGYCTEDIVGKTGYKILHDPEDLVKVEDANKERINKNVSTYELKFKAKDGRKIDFLVSGAPLFDNLGNTIGSIGAMMDITDLKRTEKAFRESQQLFQTLAQMSPVGIFRTAADGNTTYVNPKWTELSGLSFEEALDDGWLNAVHPDDREIIRKGWQIKTKIAEKSISEYRFLKKDGSIVWVLGNAMPEITDGKLVGYIGTITNITEIKLAQNELKESEERYRTIIEAFPDIIMVSDLNGNIIFGNETLELLTGITPEEYSNPSRKAGIHPDDKYIVNKAIEDLLKNKKNHSGIIENRFIDVWGNLHWFSGTISKITWNNQLVLQTITRDITEKKKIEKELDRYHNHLELLVKERTEELEKLNEELSNQSQKLQIAIQRLQNTQKQLVQSEKMASLGILAAGIAHEINNPLNFIQGGIYGIENYIKENLPEHLNETEPLIFAIQEGVRRSAEIVASLNLYSRKDDFQKAHCDINAILDSCLLMVNSQTIGKIKIVKNYDSNNLRVLCNESQIHQAILNILVNSIQSISKKGTIKISTQLDKKSVKIFIADTGCGISIENLPKITDPFFTTKDPGKGTGLGLSISFNIISEHNGTLEFVSEINSGTTAIVTLPI